MAFQYITLITLSLLSTGISIQPTFEGGLLGKGGIRNITGGAGINFRPNLELPAKLGEAAAGTINSTAGAIGAGGFGAAAAGVASGIGNGITEAGKALGDLDGHLTAELQAEINQLIQSVLEARASNDTASLRAAIEDFISASFSDIIGGGGTVKLGPLGSIDGRAGETKDIGGLLGHKIGGSV